MFEAFARPQGRVVSLRLRIPLVDATGAQTWIQVAVEGTWEGHPAGPFSFNRAVFDRLIHNFGRQRNPVPLTYEHPERGDGQPVPAAGWIHELQVRGDELWARVEFTAQAAQLIRAGEYRFCSVVVDFESIDRASGQEVGPELFEVGLTNVPFLDGMAPIRLSRRGGKETRSMSTHDILKAAIKELPDDASPEQVAKFIAGAMAQAEAVEGGGEESPAPEEPAPMSEDAAAPVEADAEPKGDDKVELMGEEMPVEDAGSGMAQAAVQAIADSAGVDAAAVLAAMQERPGDFAALVQGAPADGTAADDAAMGALAASRARDLETTVAQLSRKVSERDDEVAGLRAELLGRDIDSAVEAGHVLDQEAMTLRKLTRSNPDVVRERLGEAKGAPAVPAVDIKPSKPRGAGFEAPSTETEEYRAYERALAHIKDPEERKAVILDRINSRETRMNRRRRVRERRAQDN